MNANHNDKSLVTNTLLASFKTVIALPSSLYACVQRTRQARRVKTTGSITLRSAVRIALVSDIHGSQEQRSVSAQGHAHAQIPKAMARILPELISLIKVIRANMYPFKLCIQTCNYLPRES